MKQQLLKVINAGHKLQNTTILNKRVERRRYYWQTFILIILDVI